MMTDRYDILDALANACHCRNLPEVHRLAAITLSWTDAAAAAANRAAAKSTLDALDSVAETR